MLTTAALEEIRSIESSIDETTSRSEALIRLRTLPLCDFGELLIDMPNPAFPKLSKILPGMASHEVQRDWTGDSGFPLLVQTTDFVRALTYNYARFTLRSLEGSTAMDFGCGYGRIARLMYYFIDEANLFGVDPWDVSLKLCRDSGLTTNFVQSDWLPESLPVHSRRFDLIYAFSVFTHLSAKATVACLQAMAKHTRPGGLIAITIRPVEYWAHDKHSIENGNVDMRIQEHNTQGFAFSPHIREAVNGEIAYGDTSLSLKWLAENVPELKVVGTDRSFIDEHQLYVFLQHA